MNVDRHLRIRIIGPVVTCPAMLALVLSAAFIRSQTVSATALSMPTGRDLVAHMERAIHARNTLHIVIDLRESIDKPDREVVRYEVDASVRPQSAHEVATGREWLLRKGRSERTRLHTTVILAGNRTAVRQGRGPWSCSFGRSGPTRSIGLAEILRPRFKEAVNLGPASVGGTPVWHVRARIPIPTTEAFFVYSNFFRTMRTDLYISRSTFTLLREHASIVEGSFHQSFTERFSRYGRPIQVRLPAACRTT